MTRHDVLSAVLDLAIKDKMELHGEEDGEEFIDLVVQRLKRERRGPLN